MRERLTMTKTTLGTSAVVTLGDLMGAGNEKTEEEEAVAAN